MPWRILPAGAVADDAQRGGRRRKGVLAAADGSATCSPRQGLGHESSGTTPSNHVAFSQQLFVRAQDCIPRHFEIARQDSCRRQPSARRELSGIDRGFERAIDFAIENIVARKT